MDRLQEGKREEMKKVLDTVIAKWLADSVKSDDARQQFTEGMERLVKAVRQPDNLYHRVFPMPVQWITRRIEGDTFQHCVAAWWLYNNKTEFFASPQEAKRVRGVVKNGLVDPADV